MKKLVSKFVSKHGKQITAVTVPVAILLASPFVIFGLLAVCIKGRDALLKTKTYEEWMALPDEEKWSQ